MKKLNLNSNVLLAKSLTREELKMVMGGVSGSDVEFLCTCIKGSEKTKEIVESDKIIPKAFDMLENCDSGSGCKAI